MSTATNKAIVHRYHEQVWNEHQRELLAEFIAENVVHHGVPAAPGLQGMKEGFDRILNAFPDIQLTIDDAIAEDDQVVTRWTSRGTHRGELLGIPATGKEVTQSGASIFRLANARIVELWFYPDNMSLMQQLGVIPTLEAGLQTT